MKRVEGFGILLAFLVSLAGTVSPSAAEDLRPTNFPWGVEVFVPDTPGMALAVLPEIVFEKAARPDLGDLRVFDPEGRLLPHLLLWGTPDGPSKDVRWDLPPYGTVLVETHVAFAAKPNRSGSRSNALHHDPPGDPPRTGPYRPVAVQFIPRGPGPYLLAFGASGSESPSPSPDGWRRWPSAAFDIGVKHGRSIRIPPTRFFMASAEWTRPGRAHLARAWKRAGLYAVLALCLGLTALMARRLYAEAAAGDPRRPEEPDAAQARARNMLAALDEAGQRDFDRLRTLCRRLRDIARGVRSADGGGRSGISGDGDGINRLLWIYLKLLYSRSEIERFFQAVDPADIDDQIQRSRKRLAALDPEKGTEESPDDPAARRRKSLADLLRTAERRKRNYRCVQENHAFVALELERLSLKIASLLEMGVRQPRADEIAGEIDAVAASVGYAEQTLRELETVMGFSLEETEPPRLLEIAPAA